MRKEKIGHSFFNPKKCIQIGLIANVFLTGYKFFAGILGFSKAMVADALHSLSDILTSGVAYVGICIGEIPADKKHPYGHGNAETIAAVAVALIIFGLGIYAAFSAVSTLISGELKRPLNIALFAAIISILVKEALFRYTINVGKISNNPAVIAEAWHQRSDAYSSIAALAGIIGARISFLYLDPLAGVVVSGLIAKISLRLIRENVGIIMDERPHEEFIKNIKTFSQQTEGVKKIDSIKVHRRGSAFTADLEIAVDSKITVDEGHRIAAEVRNKLRKKMPSVREVMVHVNPYKLGG